MEAAAAGAAGEGGRPPPLGGGIRARGNSCAAPTSAPAPRPHLGAPAINFYLRGLLFAAGNSCNLFGVSLVMYIALLVYTSTHLLITHASSHRGVTPAPLQDICLHLATCLGVILTFTGDPGKVIVCTLLSKPSLKKKSPYSLEVCTN